MATILFEGDLDLLATLCKINQFGDGNAVATSIMSRQKDLQYRIQLG